VPEIRFTTVIPAPLEIVYALFTDAERFPEWFPQARAVEHLSRPMTQVGSSFTIRFHGRPDAREEVLEVVPNTLHRRRFVQGQGIAAWGNVTVRFRAVNGGTELEEYIEYGFLPRFLEPFVSALLNNAARDAMAAELEAFKAFVTRETNPASSRGSRNHMASA
jgi:uncharacterized protein YndB with AHSA1/START domain